jgi:hypothetical protein
VATEVVPVLEREVVVEMVLAEEREAVEGVLKRPAAVMEAGALRRKVAAKPEVVVVVKGTIAAIEAAAVASKRPAAAKMAGSLKAFDPREKSKSDKGGC